jgi:acetyltransferase
MCGQAGLDLPPLTDHARDGINDILKGFGWAANPSDVTGFANSESFPAIMEYMINESEVGNLVVASSGADAQAEQVIAQRDQSDKGVAFLWTGTRGATSGLPKLKEARIPIFYVPDKLAFGLRSLLGYYRWRDRRLEEGFGSAPPMSLDQEHVLAKLRSLERSTLSEHESKQLIASWGVPITREGRAASPEEAVNIAQDIGFPVVMKVDSPDILHKTEAGAIRLGLPNADQVAAAFNRITANAQEHAPGARINGVLVQEMVSNGVEVIVGVSYDEQLGPVLLFGTGGVMVEVYNDITLRLCPIARFEALEMVSQVKGVKLLQGFRGRPKADVDSLVDTLVKVSHLAVNLEGRLSELDINPLMVLPEGKGVKAADALAVFQEGA